MDVKEGLPTERVGLITKHDSKGDWLIEGIWLRSAAGIIGGQPKCCKSWLGLDMAVSVASGTDCLGHFPVKEKGPTLVFMAEDDPVQVRKRVEGICQSRGLEISVLDMTLITSPVLMLDDEADRERLSSTVERLRPKLLLLDPLVRLHRLDENNSRDIAQLLSYLRELQRRFNCSVVLTHHASKRGSSRPGQALRGSSDLHAFGDSNLYLSERNGVRELTVEHRSAPSPKEKISFQLTSDPVRLELVSGELTPQSAPLEERIISCLNQAGQPLPRADLRRALKINNKKLGDALTSLTAAQEVTSTPNGLLANR